VAPQCIEGGSLSSPLMSNYSSFRFKSVQHMSRDDGTHVVAGNFSLDEREC